MYIQKGVAGERLAPHVFNEVTTELCERAAVTSFFALIYIAANAVWW
jgi:hypothetical protein